MEALNEEDAMLLDNALDDDALSLEPEQGEELEEKCSPIEKDPFETSKQYGRAKPIVEIFPWVDEISKALRTHLKLELEQCQIIPIMENFLRCIRDDVSNYIRLPNRCFILSKYITRMLLLFKNLNRSYIDTHEYLMKVCDLLSFYTTLELRYSTKFEETKFIVADRISMNYDTHLRSFDKIYILRIFLAIRNFYKQKEIMCKLFEKYLKPRGYDSTQKELGDKIYVMYLICFKLWRSLEDDLDEKRKIESIANSYMRPTPSLRRNLIYTPYIPAYEASEVNATQCILSQQFNIFKLIQAFESDERREQFNITGDIVHLSLDDSDTELEVPKNKLNSAIKFPQIKLEEPEVVATIDLTSDKSLMLRETELPWLDILVEKTRLAKVATVRTAVSCEVIVLDSDESDNEMNADQNVIDCDSDKDLENAECQTVPNKDNNESLGEQESQEKSVDSIYKEIVESPLTSIEAEENRKDMDSSKLPSAGEDNLTTTASNNVPTDCQLFSDSKETETENQRMDETVTVNDSVSDKSGPNDNDATEDIAQSSSSSMRNSPLVLNQQSNAEDAEKASNDCQETVNEENNLTTISIVEDNASNMESNLDNRKETETENNECIAISCLANHEVGSPIGGEVDNKKDPTENNTLSIELKPESPSPSILAANDENLLIKEVQCEIVTINQNEETSCIDNAETTETLSHLEDHDKKTKMTSEENADKMEIDLVKSAETENLEQTFELHLSDVHSPLTNLKTYGNRHKKINKDSTSNNKQDLTKIPTYETTNADETAPNGELQISAIDTNKPIDFLDNQISDLIITDSSIPDEKNIHKDSEIFLGSNDLQELCLMPNSPLVEDKLSNKPRTSESNIVTSTPIKSNKSIDSKLTSPEKVKNFDDDEDDIIKNIAKKHTMNPRKSQQKKKQHSQLPSINTIKTSNLTNECSILDLPDFISSSSDENDDSSGESNFLSILDESDPADDGNIGLHLDDGTQQLVNDDDIPVDKISPTTTDTVNNHKSIGGSGNVIFSLTSSNRPIRIVDTQNVKSAKETNVIFSTSGSSQRRNFDENWIDPTLDLDENILNIHQDDITSPPMEKFTKSDKTLFKTYLNKPADLLPIELILPNNIVESKKIVTLATGNSLHKEIPSVLKKKLPENSHDITTVSTRNDNLLNLLPSTQKRKTVSFVDMPPQAKTSKLSRDFINTSPVIMQKSVQSASSRLPVKECWTRAINTYKSNINNNILSNPVRSLSSSPSPVPSLQQSTIPSINTISRRNQTQPNITAATTITHRIPSQTENRSASYTTKPWYDEKLFNAKLVLEKIDEKNAASKTIATTNNRMIQQPSNDTTNRMITIKRNLNEFDKYLQQQKQSKKRKQLTVSSNLKRDIGKSTKFSKKGTVVRPAKIRRSQSSCIPIRNQDRNTKETNDIKSLLTGDKKLRKRVAIVLEDISLDKENAKYFQKSKTAEVRPNILVTKNVEAVLDKPTAYPKLVQPFNKPAAASIAICTNSQNSKPSTGERKNIILLKPLQKKSISSIRRNALPDTVLNIYKRVATDKGRSNSGSRISIEPSKVQLKIEGNVIEVNATKSISLIPDIRSVDKTKEMTKNISAKPPPPLLTKSCPFDAKDKIKKPTTKDVATNNVTSSAPKECISQNSSLEANEKLIETKSNNMGYFINSYVNLVNNSKLQSPVQNPKTNRKQKRALTPHFEEIRNFRSNLTAGFRIFSKSQSALYNSLPSDNEVTSTQDSVTRSKSMNEIPPIDLTIPIDIQNNQIDTSTKDDIAVPRPISRRGRKIDYQNTEVTPVLVSAEQRIEKVAKDLAIKSEDTNIPTTTTMISDPPKRKRSTHKRKSSTSLSNAKQKRSKNSEIATVASGSQKKLPISSKTSSSSRESDNEPLLIVQRRLMDDVGDGKTVTATMTRENQSSVAIELAKTYSQKNFIKNVFVPPEIEKIIEAEECKL